MLGAEADTAVGIVVAAERQAVRPALLVVDISEGAGIAARDGHRCGSGCRQIRPCRGRQDCGRRRRDRQDRASGGFVGGQAAATIDTAAGTVDRVMTTAAQHRQAKHRRGRGHDPSVRKVAVYPGVRLPERAGISIDHRKDGREAICSLQAGAWRLWLRPVAPQNHGAVGLLRAGGTWYDLCRRGAAGD